LDWNFNPTDPFAGINYLESLQKRSSSKEILLLMCLELLEHETENFSSAQKYLDCYIEKFQNVSFPTILDVFATQNLFPSH